jgi:cysteine desulfurase
VLLSIGRDYAEAQGTLVFSFGIANTPEEVERALEALKNVVATLRRISPLYRKREER